MIDMSKKYRTRSGYPVRILTTDGAKERPVVGLIGGSFNPSVWRLTGECPSSRDSDLVEVDPFEGLKVDDKIQVKLAGGWFNRHYAGNGSFFVNGKSSWTAHETGISSVGARGWRLPNEED